MIDFIREMFVDFDVMVEKDPYKRACFIIDVRLYDLPLKEDIQNALDICVMAHTYLANYFIKNNYLEKYDIFFGVNNYEYHIVDEKVNIQFPTFSNECTIAINNLVKINTDANNKNLKEYHYQKYFIYPYTYEKLEEKLLKLRKENK